MREESLVDPAYCTGHCFSVYTKLSKYDRVNAILRAVAGLLKRSTVIDYTLGTFGAMARYRTDGIDSAADRLSSSVSVVTIFSRFGTCISQ